MERCREWYQRILGFEATCEFVGLAKYTALVGEADQVRSADS